MRLEPNVETLSGAFELQAARHPDRIAVASSDGAQYTYSELDRAATQIANTILTRLGAGPEPIPLLMTQGAGFMAAMLGVLKAGKTFSPLDIASPQARLAGIVRDLGARLLLTDAAHSALAEEVAREGGDGLRSDLLNIDEPGALDPDGTPTHHGPSPGDLAWISWTSGSTGKPKGVMQEHRRAVQMTHDYARITGLTCEDRLSLFHPNLTWDIFGTLLTGASIYPFDVHRNGIEAAREWVHSRELTVFRAFPTTFRSVMATLGDGRFSSVRLLHLSGETVTPDDVARFRSHFPPDCQLMVLYGSTEGGIGTVNFISHEDRTEGRVSIGRPVEGVDLRVLNDVGEECAPGEIGEIAIRSHHVFPGYWGRPDLTESAFLPGWSSPADRVFLTGDLGSVRADGQFDHAGRKDDQVKVRGHRLELADIELALQAHPAISTAAARVFDDGSPDGQKLVAYYVADGFAPSDGDLRHFLKVLLPEAIHPDRFIRLHEMPMTTNGKADRRALPSPDRQRPNITTAFVRPQTPIETAVTQIFEEYLGLESIGVHDSFFELGGKSLAAFRVLTRIASEYGVTIPPRTFFRAPNVAHAARQVIDGLLAASNEIALDSLLAELEALPE